MKKECIEAKTEYKRRQALKEIQVQRMLKQCGNTIKLLKVFENEKTISLLMEYQEGGTLGDILEKQIRISEDNARIIIAQLLLTVDFMSRRGIIHRDLKPENILLNSKAEGVYDIRIADFGFSTLAASTAPA